MLQTSLGPLINATAGTNFDGVGARNIAPPDTNMAVGGNPSYNYIFQTVNSRYAIYTKGGALVLGPNSLGSLWAPLGSNNCATRNAGDVVAQYDVVADRWVISQLGSVSSPYSECIAVSTTANPAGTYYLYSFSYGTTLNDYQKLAVWPTATNSAYLVSSNLFANGSTFTGGQLCAYDRTKMLAGDPTAQSICYTISNDGGYLPSDLDGSAPPLDGTPGYFLTFESSSSLRMYTVKPNFANPPASTLTQITPDLTVSSFSQACGGGTCVPQSGTNQRLDSLGDRLMYRLAFRNFSDHEALVVNHSVTSGSSVGVRWYELRSPVSTAASFTVYQQGTYQPDSSYRWMGSVAMDQAGDIGLGYSVSSGTLHPAVRYTGRVPGDALGTMETEASIIEGTGSQTGGLSRWGDYSAMRVDPSDDCTFWYTNEYLVSNGSYNWSTRIGSFKFSTCPAVAGNGAAFLGTDTTTQGNWKGVYGAGGYNVIDDTVSYPGFVTVTPSNQANYMWMASTSDVRALQKANSNTDRIAATWYTGGSFTVDLQFNDGQQHRVAVYCLDWDTTSRNETLSILDGSTNAVLDSRVVSAFQTGEYVVWNLSGHVVLRVTNNNGALNAVISGLFFDTAGVAAVAAPVFSPPGGSYSSTQPVMITSTTPGASIRYTTDGSTPSETSGTVYMSPVSISATTTLKAIAYKSGMADSSVTTATYTISSNSAAFVRTDTAAQGSWKGVYGASGYNVIDDTVSYPSSVTVTPAGQSNYIWAASTSDVRALQKVNSTTDRIAATWYTGGSFTVDLLFNDNLQHQLAVYCVDWDNQSRNETLSILDGSTNAVLDSRVVSSFQNGEYVVWNVSGHVVLRVSNSGVNAVISGLFFDSVGVATVAAPAFNPPGGSYSSAQSVMISSTTAGASIRYTTDGSTPSETAGTVYMSPVGISTTTTLKAIAYKSGMADSFVTSATYTISSNSAAFVRTDTATQGSWKGVYGASGYNVIDDTVSYPSSVTVTPTSQSNYIWAASTSDVRALQKVNSTTDRIAATWYTAGSFTVDLLFNDNLQHQIAVYCVDWDTTSRNQTLSILDGSTNAVLDSRGVSSFQNGEYVVWTVSGHVILRVTNNNGALNAVISGLFFQ